MLNSKFGVIAARVRYRGRRGNALMVIADLPEGVSKRSVNRFLFENGVPGAVNSHNRFKVVRVENWDHQKIIDKVGYDTPFIKSEGGKLQKCVLRYNYSGCECCGGWTEVVKL